MLPRVEPSGFHVRLGYPTQLLVHRHLVGGPLPIVLEMVLQVQWAT